MNKDKEIDVEVCVDKFFEGMVQDSAKERYATIVRVIEDVMEDKGWLKYLHGGRISERKIADKTSSFLKTNKGIAMWIEEYTEHSESFTDSTLPKYAGIRRVAEKWVDSNFPSAKVLLNHVHSKPF
ncbi:MAG: hypothetical protein HQL54_12960 [Magnetococcales bacterium]|nr:hypothetical protein [Magnetococcales bacterium]